MATMAAAPSAAAEVEYRIEIRTDLQVTARDARREAARFLLHNVGNLVSAGDPALLLAAGRIRWKVPVLYGTPARGVLGQIGDLLVEVKSGEVLLEESSPASVEEMERRAEALYHAAAGPAA